MVVTQPKENVHVGNSFRIVEYIIDLLPKISDLSIRDKLELALNNPNGFSMLYYEVFPKNRTMSKWVIQAVKVGVQR